MTHNQIDYQNLKETERHNLAYEIELNRHNVATEIETNRHNVVGEVETNRHNVATEGLMHESNMVSYSVGMANAAATRYAADKSYAVGMTRAQNDFTIGSRQADIAEVNAWTNARNATTRETEVNNNYELGQAHIINETTNAYTGGFANIARGFKDFAGAGLDIITAATRYKKFGYIN
uniref:ORF1 n=1 Tax=Macaque picobirnavirus 1 TaxID=2078789 RepID=A0A2L1FE46_9VIRU|nr:ORF1 [Macaque picobirnavirus 1]